MCLLGAKMAKDAAYATNKAMLSSKTDQSKGLCNHGEENSPKPRKPYTITKQREKWTEEEHEKFLEALKLYGRGWRNIEEHVGTKTAIQIRSHAQKFFSKVVRDSSSNNKESLIDIPPPRPKRRPNHPYPRKLTITAPTKPIIPVQSSMLDQEKDSPTSVLTLAAASDSSSTSGLRASPRQEAISEVVHFQSAEDSRESSSQGQASCNNPDMASEHGSSLKSFQLFGTMVVVKGLQSQPSSKGDDLMASSSSDPQDLPTPRMEDEKNSSQKRTIATDFSAPPAGANGHCCCGLLPFFYNMPSSQDGATEETSATPLKWLPVFSNPASFPTNQTFFGNSSRRDPYGQDASKAEDCGTASSSNSEVGAGKKAHVQSPKARGFQPYKRHRGERDEKTISPDWFSGDHKGFVPYKQCLMEREAKQQQQQLLENVECRKNQRVKLSCM